MGSTMTQHAEDYGNHRYTPGRGLWETEGLNRQPVRGAAGTQQADGVGNQGDTTRNGHGNYRSTAGR